MVKNLKFSEDSNKEKVVKQQHKILKFSLNKEEVVNSNKEKVVKQVKQQHKILKFSLKTLVLDQEFSVDSNKEEVVKQQHEINLRMITS